MDLPLPRCVPGIRNWSLKEKTVRRGTLLTVVRVNPHGQLAANYYGCWVDIGGSDPQGRLDLRRGLRLLTGLELLAAQAFQ